MPEPRTLLPPNATAAERAIEAAAAARLEAVPTPQGTLWDPMTCPAAILPWLAWAFSVDHWRAGWSEDTKRKVIAAAPAVHRLKGTRAAVEAALAAMNARVDIKEWFETGGAPHTATATVFATSPAGAQQLSADLLEDLQAAFASSAPARAHIAVLFGVIFPPVVAPRGGLLRPFETLVATFRAPRWPLAAPLAAGLLAPIEVLFFEGEVAA